MRKIDDSSIGFSHIKRLAVGLSRRPMRMFSALLWVAMGRTRPYPRKHIIPYCLWPLFEGLQEGPK